MPVRNKTVKLETLYDRTKVGNIKWYEIKVIHEPEVSKVVRTYASKIGGKPQTDTTEVYEGVNIGKANETTRQQQAELIAKSVHTKKRDKGSRTAVELGFPSDAEVSEEVTIAKGVEFAPMLAQTLENPALLEYPVDAQPKFDGVRGLSICMPEGDVVLSSRGNKMWYVPHIAEALKDYLAPGKALDGEIYIDRTVMTFQDMNGAAKSGKDVPEKPLLKFVVFDTPDETLEWRVRQTLIEHLPVYEWGKTDPNVIIYRSQVRRINNTEELIAYMEEMVAIGYEGVMVRKLDGMYQCGYRSKDLLKFKYMIEREFTIISYEEALGRNAGTPVFIVQVSKGITCAVNPEGSMEHKRKYWEMRDKLIGKKLTVRFQSYTDGGSLLFPVGVIVRGHE